MAGKKKERKKVFKSDKHTSSCQVVGEIIKEPMSATAVVVIIVVAVAIVVIVELILK